MAHPGARRRGAELRAGRGGRAVRDERGGTGIPDRAALAAGLRGAGRPACPRRSGSAPHRGTIRAGGGWCTTEDYAGRGASARMLEEYARFPLFRTVGIDSSFYAPPTEATLASYAEHLPPGFPCVSKVWNQLTVQTFAQGAGQGAGGPGQSRTSSIPTSFSRPCSSPTSATSRTTRARSSSSSRPSGGGAA